MINVIPSFHLLVIALADRLNGLHISSLPSTSAHQGTTKAFAALNTADA
jgi:hypothetical protein